MIAALLWTLIAVTFAGWCLPMLFFPRPLLRKFHVPVNEPVIFVRLLGAAALALCLHYYLGLLRLENGRDPSDVIVIGLIHCGMSAAIIWRYALHGHYRRWPRATQVYIYTSGSILTALTFGLLFAGLWHE